VNSKDITQNPLNFASSRTGDSRGCALPDVYSGYQKVTAEAAREKFAKAWGVTDLPDEVALTVTTVIKAGLPTAAGNLGAIVNHPGV